MYNSKAPIRAWLLATAVVTVAIAAMSFLPSSRVQSHVAQSDNQAASFDQQWRLWHSQHGEANPQQRLKLARREYERRRAAARRQAVRASGAGPTWTSLGPTNGAGRMTAITVHPVTERVYAGADNGGVWRSFNAGGNWEPLTDSLPFLEVGALAIATRNQIIIYVGTGSAPVYGVREMNRGIGLLKSTDDGATWSFPSSVVATRFFKISVRPDNPDDLVVGTNAGGLRSTDGGQTWTEVIPRHPGESLIEVNDVARDSSNAQILYATVYSYGAGPARVVKSIDGGASWVEKSSGLPANGLQIALAITPSTPQVLYATTATATANEVLSHVYKSINGGDSWVELTDLSTNADADISHFLGGVTDVGRNHTIIVSPTDANTILAGGVHYVRSTDGGSTWHQPPFNNATPLTGSASMSYTASHLYLANESGVWETPDDGNTVIARNESLVTRQYLSLTSDPVLLNRIYAGSQGNGTDRRPDEPVTAWAHFNTAPGNGIDSYVDPAVYRLWATAEDGRIFYTTDADSDSPSFVLFTPPFGYSPRAFTRLAVGGNYTNALYTIDSTVWHIINSQWVSLPTTITDGSSWDYNVDPLSVISVAPSDNSVIMISKDSVVLRSTNGGNTWTKVLTSQFGAPKNIEIDPANANLVYIATPGWDGNQFNGKLYVTNNGGASWTQRGTGLPQQAAMQVVRVDPFDTNTLYCGTDIGVYRSTDQGFTWAPFGDGLPAVPVTDLRVVADGGSLRAATFGRGVWAVPLRSVQANSITCYVNTASDHRIDGVALSLRTQGNNVVTKPTSFGGTADFLHLAAGLSYTVTPSLDGYLFNPASRTFVNMNGSQVASFTGYRISDLSPGLNGYSPDLDGDGKCDLGLYRSGLWSWLKSSQLYSADSPQFFSWGDTGLQPICADFDGDGKADIAYIVPPSSGQSATYAILLSSRNYSFAAGQPLFMPAGFPSMGDAPVVGDFDGDGKADPGVWRATQGIWFIPKSSSFDYNQFIFAQWGELGDVPIAADFDHDGRADMGYYHNGTWGVLQSSHNFSTDFPLFFSWGGTGLQPIVADFDGDGRADIGYMVPPSSGQSATYAILLSSRNYSFAAGQPLFVPAGFPSIGDTPIVGDFDGDGKADPGIWRSSQGVWIIPTSSSNYTQYIFSQWGGPGDIALPNTTGRH
ncbi:MAG: hypothetical protein ACJ74G_01955 [Blastocatellia bacterium]